MRAFVSSACCLLLLACPRSAPAPAPAPPTLAFLDPPTRPGAMAPNLVASSRGTLLSWLEPITPGDRSRWRLRASRLAVRGWEPAVTLAEGEDFFANWADFPALVEAGDGSLLAHRLARLGETTYAYGVELLRSTDAGGRWQRSGWLHADRSPSEHGFVSFLPVEGDVRAFWLDGNATGGETGAMQLRTALVASAGPVGEEIIDDRVCDCCQTSAALAASGPVVAYRDRSPEEVRDVAVIRRTAAGWSQPVSVAADGWQIHGCPVNGPALAARGDLIAVAWFTAAQDRPRVQLAFSHDGGASFGAPLVVDDQEPAGRVALTLGSTGEALVVWLGRSGEQGEIRVRRADPAAGLGAATTLVRTTLERSAGFPRILMDGSGLLLAWTEDGEPSRLRVARVAID